MLELNAAHATSFVIVTHDIALARRVGRAQTLVDGVLIGDDVAEASVSG